MKICLRFRFAPVALGSLLLGLLAACTVSVEPGTTPPVEDGGSASPPDPASDAAAPPEQPGDAGADGADTPGDASADASVDSGDGGIDQNCGLPSPWRSTVDGTDMTPSEQFMLIRASRFSFVETTVAMPMAQPDTRLWLHKQSGVGFVKSDFLQVGGCTRSGSTVSCAADEYFTLLGNQLPKANHVLAYLTQTHNPKYGYGTFQLRKIDPYSGAMLRDARLPTKAGQTPPVYRASKAISLGYDVVVVGEANNELVGQTGSGPYFRAYFGGFLGPTCTPDPDVVPDAIERSEVPFKL